MRINSKLKTKSGHIAGAGKYWHMKLMLAPFLILFILFTVKWIAIIDAGFIIYDFLPFIRLALDADSASDVFAALSPIFAALTALANFLALVVWKNKKEVFHAVHMSNLWICL